MVRQKDKSTAFSEEKRVGSIFTGGQVKWTGSTTFTLASGGVNLVRAGQVVCKLEEEEDPVLCLCLDREDDNTVVTAHKSGLVRLWSTKDVGKPEVTKTFRSIHNGPVVLLELHRLHTTGGRVLASGGADGSVKVWDLDHQYYTHNLRSQGVGVCTLVTFHPTTLSLYAGCSSGGLFCWDLTTSRLAHRMEAHFSTVTAFSISSDGSHAVSVGRDAVVVVWNLTSHTKQSTVPVFSAVEGLVLLPNLVVVLATGTSLTVWDLTSPKQTDKLELGSEVTTLVGGGDSADIVRCATGDHNLVTVSLAPKLSVKAVTVGNNDEVLDLVHLGPDGSHLAVACNSPALRLYNQATWDCRLATGHTDTVLCLATCPADPTILASGGKDKEVRVWRLEGLDTDLATLQCLVVGSGHAEALGGLAFSPDTVNQLVTVSKDTTLKVWTVDLEGGTMSSVRTEIAHDKDINCVAMAPGGTGLVATGSQDRLAKLWRASDLGLVSVLKGHTRGVWCARFSPQDRLLATGSADSTIRLWSLAEGNCVKQLEGHESSVLRLSWGEGGGQMVSSSSEGLVKVWWVARQECTATLDTGEGKVWALGTRNQGGRLVITAGSSTGQITVWRDSTEEEEQASQADQDKLVVQHQRLNNLLQDKKWGEAVKLALKLTQPFTALKIIKKLPFSDLKFALHSLDPPGLDQLLGYTVKWNSNSRHCAAAQAVLHVVLTTHDSDFLVSLPNSSTWLPGLLPYTEKHMQRLTRLNIKSKFVPYLLHQIKSTSLPIVDSLIATET